MSIFVATIKTGIFVKLFAQWEARFPGEPIILRWYE